MFTSHIILNIPEKKAFIAFSVSWPRASLRLPAPILTPTHAYKTLYYIKKCALLKFTARAIVMAIFII